MEKFIEKFNIFDLFTMLLPGITISCLFGVSLYSQYADCWNSLGGEKYFLFFIFSYICGLLFQELGRICDEKFVYRILYRGDPRKIFLIKDKYKKVFSSEISYANAKKVGEYLTNFIGLEIPESTTEEEKNSIICSFCLNICEIKGLSGKPDKMITISEMSRSLALGCIATIILNIALFLKDSGNLLDLTDSSKFLLIEIPFLFLISLIFFYRKKRYEKYRLQILLRIFQFSFCRENPDNLL